LQGLVVAASAFLAATPAGAFRGGFGARGGFAAAGPRGAVAVGPRGGGVAVGARGGTAVRGPYGGGAAVGPYGGAAVRGPRGAGAAVGPYGGAAVRGPRGGAAAVGPYGGAVRGPGGYARGYYYGGRYWRGPVWGARGAWGYGRGFVGYPGWRYYGTVGLVPALAGVAALGFLSSGVLIGTYGPPQQTVYVYVVNDGDENKEYVVDANGQILSVRTAPPTE
jgi:hypothetical protein